MDTSIINGIIGTVILFCIIGIISIFVKRKEKAPTNSEIQKDKIQNEEDNVLTSTPEKNESLADDIDDPHYKYYMIFDKLDQQSEEYDYIRKVTYDIGGQIIDEIHIIVDAIPSSIKKELLQDVSEYNTHRNSQLLVSKEVFSEESWDRSCGEIILIDREKMVENLKMLSKETKALCQNIDEFIAQNKTIEDPDNSIVLEKEIREAIKKIKIINSIVK